MHNRIESFYGFPSNIEWINSRKTFTQRCTFQGTGEMIRLGYSASTFLSLVPQSDGTISFLRSSDGTGTLNISSSQIIGTTAQFSSFIICPVYTSNGTQQLGSASTAGTITFTQSNPIAKFSATTGSLLLMNSNQGTFPSDGANIRFGVYQDSTQVTGGSGITVTNGSPTLTMASNVLYNLKYVVVPGESITISSTAETRVISSIDSSTQLTATSNFTASSVGNTAMTRVAGVTPSFSVFDNGKIGIRNSAPTAFLHLPAGYANAEYAPLKFISGTNLTTPEAGAVEYDGSELYETNSTAVRGTIPVIRSNVSSAGTLSLANTYTLYVFSGTTTTWTLPTIAGNTNHMFHIKNRGSGAITLNSNAGGNEIYNTAAASSLTINAGEHYMLINDGTYWLVC